MDDIQATVEEFRVGRVIARSVSTFFRNFAAFGLIALVLTSPIYVYAVLTGPSEYFDYDGNQSSIGYEFITITIIEILLTYAVTAALVYGTVQDLKNNKVSLGDCFSQGLARMFPVLGVAIVSGIVTLAAFLPVALGIIFRPAGPVLLIPGLIVIVMLWVTIPVAVLEQRGLGSLSRSAGLTKGYRWRIFFVFINLGVVDIGLSFLLTALSDAMPLGGVASDGAFAGAVAIEWILSALTSTFMAVVYTVSYHDLRVAREGVDTGQIAAVFD